MPSAHRPWLLGVVLAASTTLAGQTPEGTPSRPSERDPAVAEKIDTLRDAWRDRRQRRDGEAVLLILELSERAERPLHEADEKAMFNAFRDVLLRGKLRDPELVAPYHHAANGLARFGAKGQKLLRRVYEQRRFPRKGEWQNARVGLIRAIGTNPDADSIEFLLERVERDQELLVLHAVGEALGRCVEADQKLRKQMVEALAKRLADWELQVANPPPGGSSTLGSTVNLARSALSHLGPTWMEALSQLTGGVECESGVQWTGWYQDHRRETWRPIPRR